MQKPQRHIGVLHHGKSLLGSYDTAQISRLRGSIRRAVVVATALASLFGTLGMCVGSWTVGSAWSVAFWPWTALHAAASSWRRQRAPCIRVRARSRAWSCETRSAAHSLRLSHSLGVGSAELSAVASLSALHVLMPTVSDAADDCAAAAQTQRSSAFAAPPWIAAGLSCLSKQRVDACPLVLWSAWLWPRATHAAEERGDQQPIDNSRAAVSAETQAAAAAAACGRRASRVPTSASQGKVCTLAPWSSTQLLFENPYLAAAAFEFETAPFEI